MMKTNHMKFKTLILFVPLLVIVLAACASPGATSLPETLPAATQAPATKAVATSQVEKEQRPVAIESVQVEIGVGSPIPVDVVASGTWPGLCAQLAQVEQRFSAQRFEISLLATAEDPNCPPDAVGLPFRMAIPLNIVELPTATYAVAVNGVETSFDWTIAPASGGTPVEQATAAAGDLHPLDVADARVEIGVGSPVPVEIVVSGDWPGLCAQLAQLEQRISGQQIEISLLSTPVDPQCPPDYAGVPYRIAVPLNLVEVPEGSYMVTVNGFETSFEWTGTSPENGAGGEPPAANATIAYIGIDGNLWVIEGGSAPRQLTQDATPESYPDRPAPTVRYYFPRISSDGNYVAVRRDAGTPVESGMQYEFGLWVYDLTGGEARLVYDQSPAGFDWKPDSHLLAYGAGVEEDYFMNRGQPDPSAASGVWAFDLDTGSASELVKPERGFALYTPVWSPDGRYLSFDELLYIEGRGSFAYYDFEAQQYTSWEEPIGTYDWAPDSSHIVYDRLTYTASGEERIFVRPLRGGQEQQISPELPGGYAFNPVYSPQGDRIAYLLALGGPDSNIFNLYVQDLAGGEARDLGSFESVWYLEWTPDGEYLIFSAGPYEARQVLQVGATDGTVTVLAQGQESDVAGK
jgi:Tol biopolymer transport system component